MPPKRSTSSTRPAGEPGKRQRAAGGAAAASPSPADGSGAAEAAAAALPDIEDAAGASAVLSPAAQHDIPHIQQELISWYDRIHRRLPWRESPTARLLAGAAAATWAQGTREGPPQGLAREDFAYGVWVSEVERVCEYFLRWVTKWPTVAALAAATQEEANELWAGLGYYRRAKFLLEGAKFCVEHHNGRLPSTAKELHTIPGIGPYTAAAVASIAYGEREAAVDGNVIRVLSRLHAYSGDSASGPGLKAFQAMADALLHGERPGDWNQAMMELGATVCSPKSPNCGGCPVASQCKAYQSPDLDVQSFPKKAPKSEKREEAVLVRVVCVQHGNTRSVLLVRRPHGGLLGGLWEFPSAVSPAADAPETREEALDAMLARDLQLPSPGGGGSGAGAGAGEVRKLGEVVHVFSHVRQTMSVVWHRVTLPERPALPAVEAAAPLAEAPAEPEEAAAEAAEGTGAKGGAKKGKAPAKGKRKGKKAADSGEEGAAAAAAGAGGGGGPREYKWVELGGGGGPAAAKDLETLSSGQQKVWALVTAANVHKAGGGAGTLAKLWGAAAAKK